MRREGEQEKMTKEAFFARGDEHFFFEDGKGCAAYCREHWAEDCAHIIQVADRVCRNTFLFDLGAGLL